MRFKSFLLTAFAGIALAATSPLAADLAAAPAAGPTVLAIGDSLMAGYQLEAAAAFPAQLQAHLRAGGINARVINAGVSGDTSAGGLARLDWALAGVKGGIPDLVIIEFGGNDALRGIDPVVTRGNLNEILSKLQGRGLTVLLVGMRAPPNMGSEYTAEFDAIFPDLAEFYDLALYPFFLDGVALRPELKLQDGIHPNRAGVAVMVEGMAPLVEELLAD